MNLALFKYSTVFILIALLIAGCGGQKARKADGGYYGGDSPPLQNRDFSKIPDAVPKPEPLSRTGNKPYTVFGKSYKPLSSSRGFVQAGVASWYGKKFHGRRTSSGEIYDIWKMTAAHPTLPLPTYVRVTSLNTGKNIVVKVNDRGPFLHNRIIDLSYAAAHKLGIAKAGTGRVRIEALQADKQSASEIDTEIYEVQSGYAGFGGEQAYLIQVGAYTDRKNVRIIRNKLAALNFSLFPTNIETIFLNNPPYKVRVGPYSEIESALRAQKSLKNILGYEPLLLSKD